MGFAMGLNYRELDAATRRWMQQELERDLLRESLVLSERLSPRGRTDFILLLQQAIETPDGSDKTLAQQLGSLGRMEAFEPKRGSSRRIGRDRMATDANEVLAEYEFNRLYMRAICLRALANGETEVQVYRGRTAVSQKHRSTHLEDRLLPAQLVLEDLRRNAGRQTETGLGRPRSGLTLCTLAASSAGASAPEAVGAGTV